MFGVLFLEVVLPIKILTFLLFPAHFTEAFFELYHQDDCAVYKADCEEDEDSQRSIFLDGAGHRVHEVVDDQDQNGDNHVGGGPPVPLFVGPPDYDVDQLSRVDHRHDQALEGQPGDDPEGQPGDYPLYYHEVVEVVVGPLLVELLFELAEEVGLGAQGYLVGDGRDEEGCSHPHSYEIRVAAESEEGEGC